MFVVLTRLTSVIYFEKPENWFLLTLITPVKKIGTMPENWFYATPNCIRQENWYDARKLILSQKIGFMSLLISSVEKIDFMLENWFFATPYYTRQKIWYYARKLVLYYP